MYDVPGPPQPHEHGPKTFRGERFFYITLECWTTIFIFCFVIGVSLTIVPLIVSPGEELLKYFEVVVWFFYAVPPLCIGAIVRSLKKRKEAAEAAEAERRRVEARRRRNRRVVRRR